MNNRKTEAGSNKEIDSVQLTIDNYNTKTMNNEQRTMNNEQLKENTGFFTTRVQNDGEEDANTGFFGTSSLRMTGKNDRIDFLEDFN